MVEVTITRHLPVTTPKFEARDWITVPATVASKSTQSSCSFGDLLISSYVCITQHRQLYHLAKSKLL